jgi:LysR family glycine cleavage system transcriptional activator
LQAAADGQGVAMGRSALAAGYLAEGRLVRPFELKLHSDAAYYVIYPQAYAQRPKVKAFRDFLMAEAERADAQGR